MLLRALLYLRLTSGRNQTRSALKRLREPRYLAGAVATGLYFYYFVYLRLGGQTSGRYPRGAAWPVDFLLIITAMIVVLTAGWVALAWAFPSDRPALRFSSAEIAFLFPAPIARRSLIHFSLLGGQLRILIQALILGLIWSRRGFTPGAAAMHIVGWWLLFSLADLHRTAANLTFARIRESGASILPARTIALAVIGLFVAATIFSLRQSARLPLPSEMSDARAFGRYLDLVLRSGPLPWLLWPFRAAVAPFLATDAATFFPALGPAVLLLAAHYAWVARQEVAFEEGSIADAEKRADRSAALASGRSPWAGRRARRDPFALPAQGRPEIAFLWKNLLSLQIAFEWRILRFLPALLGLVIFAAQSHRGPAQTEAIPVVVLAFSACVAFYTVLLGPQLARQDLRSDMSRLDLLRSYPLAGWQIVLGEILTPVAILCSLLWACLLAALWAAGGVEEAHALLSPAERLACAACLAGIAPVFCSQQLLISNAGVLLFPQWHRTAPARGGGFEAIGQRMLFVVGQLLLVAIASLPAVVAAPLIVFASEWLIGFVPAVLLATAAVLLILGGEVACGLWWLGTRFERLDLAADLGT